MEALLDAHQLTTMLGVSRRTLESIIEKQQGPAFILIGRQRRWRPSDVNAWYESRLAQCTVRPNAVDSNGRGDGITA
ncbi:helix-turn-helix transcriptional regulator [Rhodoferax ferrireducens]|uniref:helix-turn-helix transcriptional regulator n=1 Tax=Rhodoferax ferrireducens TaxID=192843 RepID=UPI00384F60A5